IAVVEAADLIQHAGNVFLLVVNRDRDEQPHGFSRTKQRHSAARPSAPRPVLSRSRRAHPEQESKGQSPGIVDPCLLKGQSVGLLSRKLEILWQSPDA